MTLELKHLAPYLPYDINVRHASKLGNIKKIAKLTISDYPWLSRQKYFKPILKPISDLSLLLKDEFEKYSGKINGKVNTEIIELFCIENTNNSENLEDVILSSLPYECIEYMFKNHYDFFGLIDKGIAIDINTLK